MFNIVLVHPQIPQNTGSIGRICVNTDSRLHIVKPIGFDMSEKALRRAGLDYWKLLDVTVWESLDDFLKTYEKDKDRFFFSTTKTDKPYFLPHRFNPETFSSSAPKQRDFPTN